MSVEVVPASITVSCTEVHPRPALMVDRDGRVSGTMRFRVAWEDALTFAQEVLGRTVEMDGRLVRYLPLTHPLSDTCVAMSTSIQPFGKPSGADAAGRLTYEAAIVDVNFEAEGGGVDPADETETLVEESLEPNVEMLTWPGAGLFWDSAKTVPVTSDEIASEVKPVYTMDWVYRRRGLRSLPSAIVSLMGHVNASAVVSMSLGLTFEAETLLYNPPVISRTRTTDGWTAFDVTYRFTARPWSWNKFWRRGYDEPQPIYKPNGSQFKPYPTGNFGELLA